MSTPELPPTPNMDKVCSFHILTRLLRKPSADPRSHPEEGLRSTEHSAVNRPSADGPTRVRRGHWRPGPQDWAAEEEAADLHC